MVYLRYMLAELGRRKGRTVLTALGLAAGVGLVIVVGALSAGLDDAREEVLAPLTGVGTDMTVTRPISIDEDAAADSRGPGGPAPISEEERQLLQEENGGGRLDFAGREPGTEFSETSFMSSQISFASDRVAEVESMDGVAQAAGGLTLTMTTISGTVPDFDEAPQPGQGGPPGGGGGGMIVGGGANVQPITVTGVDASSQDLGAITAGQVTSGSWFGDAGKREAILDAAYAAGEGIAIGDTVDLDGKDFTVVGLAETPLGGQASDVYVRLGRLQAISGRQGRINTLYARATDADAVAGVATSIETAYPDTSVTTAETLASQVSGSLVDAEELTSNLGLALQVVGLLGAVLIASLLTLSSVAKRVRELGTLSAIGWPRRLIVRQVAGESLLQGLLGGLLGVALGVAAAAVASAVAPELTAEVASTGAGLLPGPFGQGAAAGTASEPVALTASVSAGLALLAVGLAVAGGLVAGAVGGLRAARLRPADALRRID